MRWLWVLCAACGRVGFDPATGPGASTIEVHVYGNAAEPDHGVAQPNAVVVVGDTVERTDAQGIVRVDVDGTTPVLAAVHAAGGRWYLYSYDAMPPGSLVIAGDSRPPTFASLTITLPSAGAASVDVIGDAKCLFDFTGGTVTFDAKCAGPRHLYATASTSGFITTWIDLGIVNVQAGATFDYSAAVWQNRVTLLTTVNGVPVGTNTVASIIYDDTFSIVGLGSGAPVGMQASFNVYAVGAAPHTYVAASMPTNAGGTSLVRLASGTTFTFVASDLPAPIDGYAADPAQRKLSWSGATSNLPVVAVQCGVGLTTGATQVLWTAAVAGNPGEIAFPTLPPELAALNNDATTTWQPTSIVRIHSDKVEAPRALRLLGLDPSALEPGDFDDYGTTVLSVGTF